MVLLVVGLVLATSMTLVLLAEMVLLAVEQMELMAALVQELALGLAQAQGQTQAHLPVMDLALEQLAQ
jgi:hypothetical protein